MDDKAIRDNIHESYDYLEFIKVMNQAFPGIDARTILFCTDIFETSSKTAIIVNNFIPTKYSKGFICISGHLLQWRDFVHHFSLHHNIDQEVSDRCAVYWDILLKIDKDIFK